MEDMNQYSRKIREIAEKLGMERRLFIAKCIGLGLGNDAAEYLWDGTQSNDPRETTKQIVSKVLKTPKETIFGEK